MDISKTWPFGLGGRQWALGVVGPLAALAVAFYFDRDLSIWAQGWPEPVVEALRTLTRYGESDWILYPSAFFFVVTAALALVVRWKLMKTILWQFAALYGFIFTGVAVPSLFTTVAKRLVGRGRPQYLETEGTLSLMPNWLDWTHQSFPSGHSTTAFALAVVVGMLSKRWLYPALVFAAAVAVSRVALGVHYASDVTAGAIIGIIGAHLVRLLFAQRRWVFDFDRAGGIVARPMSSLRRYLILKRRGSAIAQPTGRP